MSIDPLSFLTQSQNQKESSDPLSFLNAPKKTSLRKTGRALAQYGIGNVERLAFPYELAIAPERSKNKQLASYRENLFGDIERLLEQKQMGDWDAQNEELLKNLTAQAKNPELSDPFLKTADIGTASLIEKGAKQFGVDLHPEDLSETGARIGGNLLSPKSLLKGAKALPSKFSKESIEAKKWANLEKYASKDPVRERILNFAKDRKLPPEQATMLMQSKGNIDILGKMSKKSKSFEKNVSSLKENLKGSYEELRQLGKEKGFVTPQEAEMLTDDLGKILTDINKTYIEGPDTKSARIAIEEAIKKVNEKAGTIEELINSRRNVSQSTNWKNVDEGDVLKQRAKEAFFKAIERKDPKIAKQLQETDSAYGTYKKYEKLFKKKQPLIKVHGVEVPNLATAIAFGSVAFKALSIPSAIKGLALKEGVQRLSTRLLTDPKFQGIHKKLTESIMTGSKQGQKNVLLALRSLLKKEDPDLYEDFKDITIE